MNVNLMRRIDYWCGIPLCALATLWVAVSDRVAKLVPTKKTVPEKILFIELSEMGSAILVDPALRYAQQKGAQIYFLIFAMNRASLGLLNTVPPENVWVIRENSLVTFVADTLKFLWCVRQHKIDTVIDLELFSRFTALLTGMSGAQRRIGFHAFHNEGLWRGNLLTHKVPYNNLQHISKSFWTLVESAYQPGSMTPLGKWTVPALQLAQVSAQHSDEMRATIKSYWTAKQNGSSMIGNPDKIVLINPNASDLLPQRRWAPERFSALIEAIMAHDSEHIVLLTGAPKEKDWAENILQKVNPQFHARVINFAGAIKFSDLPELYFVARVMVTNDSGPAHFAAITPLPTIVLFGPETPALYGSLGRCIPITAQLSCSPCVSASNHRKTPCTDNQCMQAIDVAQVMDKVRPFLN